MLTEKGDARWWIESPLHKPHELINAIVRQMRQQQSQRREAARQNAIYYGVDLEAFGLSNTNPYQDDVLTINAAENAIDTYVSKTAKSRVLPMAITSRGEWSQRKRAKMFNQFIEGMFDECDVFERDSQLVTDTLLFGTGVAKVIDGEGDDIIYERVFCWELMADPSESRYGKPRSIYQRHFVDRLVLLERFKDDEEATKAIKSLTYSKEDDDLFIHDSSADMVIVIDAWHLPSGHKAKDGRFCQVISNYTLVDESYDRHCFPFAFMYEKEPVAGIWGRSMMSKLMPMQKEFDKLNQKIQDAHDIMGVPRLIVHRGANISRGHLDDETASIIETDDMNGVHEWNAQPVHPDTYMYRNGIPADMLKFAGISEMSAQSAVPRGITAARALQVLDDSESERMSVFWKQRERFYRDVARLMLSAARDKAKNNPDFAIKAKTKRNLEVIKFKDIDISEDEYSLAIYPTSLLAKAPAAKYQQLSEMRDRGDITPAQFRQMSEMPDLEAENELDTAPQEVIDKNIDAILTDGMAVTCEPFDDHVTVVTRGARAYNQARLWEVDESHLELLRRYIEDAQAYISTAAPPPMPDPGLAPTIGPSSDPTLVPQGPPMPMAGPPMGGPPPVGGPGPVAM